MNMTLLTGCSIIEKSGRNLWKTNLLKFIKTEFRQTVMVSNYIRTVSYPVLPDNRKYEPNRLYSL